MKLPPDVNLLAATHYIQALEVQRIANKIVTILGSKTPHIQNLAVGGVANAINPDSQSTLTLERLYAIKALIDELGDFVQQRDDERRRRGRRALCGLDEIRRRRHQLSVGARSAARHQGHEVRASRRLHPGGRSVEVPGRSPAIRTPISATASRKRSSTPGTSIRARAPRCIRSTVRPRRNTTISTTTGNTPGSRRRPSSTSARRSVRSPTCWACTPPATSRPSGT